MLYCSDIDLLQWEPTIFNDAALAAQTLIAGAGDLAGSSFTIASGSFTAARVPAFGVIALTGAISGCYPILEVTNATTLMLSTLHGSWTDDASPEAGAIGSAAGLNYVIRTFAPQAGIVSEMLRQAVGLVPGMEDVNNVTILNPQVLRRPCVLGTLHLVYSAMAAMTTEPAIPSARADMYERMYRRALRSVKVDLDCDADGRPDQRRALNVLRTMRA